MPQVHVSAFWDAEASVWVATSNDVPGLVVEADTMPSLIAELEDLIPEMMRENGLAAAGEIAFDLSAQYRGMAHAAEA